MMYGVKQPNLKLTSSEKNEIVNFAQVNHKNSLYFKPNGVSRQFCIVSQTDTPISDLCLEILKNKYEELGINEYQLEPVYGIFIGVNNEGGFVHEHSDPCPDNFIHTRLNFLLSKPIDGGMPIINGNVYEMQEDDCWINLASRWKHSSTKVIGKKDRIVLSLGALVGENIIMEKFPNLFN